MRDAFDRLATRWRCEPRHATPEIARFVSKTVCQTRQGKPTADWAARELLKPARKKPRRR